MSKFYLHFGRSFFFQMIPKAPKKTVWLSIFFCAFGIFRHKSCLLNVVEIDYIGAHSTEIMLRQGSKEMEYEEEYIGNLVNKFLKYF